MRVTRPWDEVHVGTPTPAVAVGYQMQMQMQMHCFPAPCMPRAVAAGSAHKPASMLGWSKAKYDAIVISPSGAQLSRQVSVSIWWLVSGPGTENEDAEVHAG